MRLLRSAYEDPEGCLTEAATIPSPARAARDCLRTTSATRSSLAALTAIRSSESYGSARRNPPNRWHCASRLDGPHYRFTSSNVAYRAIAMATRRMFGMTRCELTVSKHVHVLERPRFGRHVLAVVADVCISVSAPRLSVGEATEFRWSLDHRSSRPERDRSEHRGGSREGLSRCRRRRRRSLRRDRS